MKRTFTNIITAIFFMAVILSTSNSWGQYKNVKISDIDNVCEPSISINPVSPNKIVVGADLNWVFYSDDFGHTWQTRELKGKYGSYGNPCIISDNEGKYYYFHLSDPEGLGWKSNRILDRIVCQTSLNAKNWDRGKSIGFQSPTQHDKEWAVFDEFTGNIYVTWTQFDRFDSENPNDSSKILFTYSDDRGRSWKHPVKINNVSGTCHNTNETAKGAMPAVGPKGEVYVVWTLNEKIYFDKTVDGGISWLKKDKIIGHQTGGWDINIPGFDHCPSFPTIVCDLSYDNWHGSIYICWADQRNGDENTDIWIVRSDDAGETWSEPKKVNDDNTETHQFFSWMTIDQITGSLYIQYYDRRNHSDNKTDVFLAYSSDGGKTFTNTKISEAPFEPLTNSYFGDYNGIAAHAGYVRPVWTRVDNGKRSIWTAIIDMF